MTGLKIPVESRKRTAFVFRPRGVPPAGFCNLVDPTFGGRGVYSRPYGDKFLGMISPHPADDLHTDSLEPDWDLFSQVVAPALGQRVHGFEDLELVDAWAGHYEMNTFDQNAIIGSHPTLTNFIFACGLSGHGVMHAPAIGRGISELLATGAYQTQDLSLFRFERIAANARLDDVQASEHRKTAAAV